MDKTRDRYGGLFERLDAAASFMLANLLFVVCSIPIITLPAAVAGLFAVTSKWTHGESPEVFADFFGGLRKHWRKATLIGLVNAAVLGLAILNFTIFPHMNLSAPLTLLAQSSTLFVALAVSMATIYLWPLLVAFDLPVREVVLLAFRLAFAHPLWSGAVVLAVLAIILVSLILPAAFFILGTFSAISLVASRGAWRIIRRYMTKDEPESTL